MWSKQSTDVRDKNMTSFRNKISNRKRKTTKSQAALNANNNVTVPTSPRSTSQTTETPSKTNKTPSKNQPPTKEEKNYQNAQKSAKSDRFPDEAVVIRQQNRPERQDSIKRYSDSFIIEQQVVINENNIIRAQSGLIKEPIEDRTRGRRFSDYFRYSGSVTSSSTDHKSENRQEMVQPQPPNNSKSRKKRNKKNPIQAPLSPGKNPTSGVKIDSDDSNSSYLQRVKSKIYNNKNKNDHANNILPSKVDPVKSKSKAKKTSESNNMADFRKSLSNFDFRLMRQHSNLEWIRPSSHSNNAKTLDPKEASVAVNGSAKPLLTKAKSSSAINLSMLRMRRSKLMDYAQMAQNHRISENVHDEFDFIAFGSVQSVIGDTKPGQPVSRSGSDRRPDLSHDQTARASEAAGQDHAQEAVSPVGDNAGGPGSSSASSGGASKRKNVTNINRSESVKEISEKRKQRRNISDPSHNTTRLFKHSSGGVGDVDHQGVPTPLLSGSTLSHTESGSSSNSSISCNGRLSESPSNSAEVLASPVANSDSDLEVDDPLNWQQLVTEEQLKNLKPHEKKRQDVINELFQTEASHVRSLKVLYKIFYKSLQENQSLKTEELHLIFPNIKEVLDIHTHISREMKKRRKEDPLVRELGDILVGMFDDRLRKAAATFCERQQQALDFIKDKRKKDSKFESVLCECEKKRQCRRLPLQGILPVEMQRLSKYPLLLERLISSVEQGDEDNSEELSKLKRAHQMCKEILNHVNEAAKQASNKARLEEIQRHLDTSNFERASENTIAQEFRSVDLTRYTYVLEGPMQLRRPNKGPVPVHILLLEEAVVLLQREGERYVLKFFQSGSSAQPQPLSPIIKMSTLLVRTNAVHKSALFLVNTSTNNSQMYDLIAEDDLKRDQWFKHFSDAADAYNKREGKTKRPESATDLPSDGLSQDSGHESVEEMAQPENAVAECTSNSVENVESQATTEDGSPEAIGDGDGTDSAANLSTKVGPDDWPLVQPSQVQVLTPPVHVAESKLTPLEQIRRKSEQVQQALSDKEALVADLLNIPREDFHDIADMAVENHGGDLTELVLSTIHLSNQLYSVINQASSNITESDPVHATGGLPACASQETAVHQKQQMPSVPCHILRPIAAGLSSHLNSMLSAVKNLDEERDRYRKELHRLRERLHQDNELHPHASEVQEEPEQDKLASGSEQSSLDPDAEPIAEPNPV